MRGRVARSAFALGSAGLVVLGIAGCHQQSERRVRAEAAPADLKIVEQVQIDENGAEVKPPEGADGRRSRRGRQGAVPAGVDRDGGRAHRARRRAGHQHQERRAAGRRQAQRRQSRLPGAVEDRSTPRVTRRRPPRSRRRSSTTRSPSASIGPAFSGETNATGPVFNQAGLVAATASATNVTLSEKGWKTFFRGLANDGVQGPSVANYMKNTLGYNKVCVVDDSTDYGLGLAQAVRETLGPVADSSCNISVKKGDKDFSAAVTQIKGASPDAVFFAGYYAEAAPFVAAAAGRRLRRHLRHRRRRQGSGVRQAGGCSRPRTHPDPARAARPPAPSPRSTTGSSTRSRAPTAPRATTWARSC